MGIKSATSLTRSGVSDWIVQRLSAVVLAIYSTFLLGYFAFFDVDFDSWQALMVNPVMIASTIFALLALAAHAWIGLWTISTDYFTERHMGGTGTLVRWLFQIVSALVLVGSVVWAILILLGAA